MTLTLAASVLLFPLFVHTATSASFEPAELDVPRALSDYGIDVTELPRITDDSIATTARCATACTLLEKVHGSENVIQQGTTAFTNFTSSYFTQQQATTDPHCCPFAVKSGGHGLFTGSSSSIGGITVSLEKLSSIEVSDDRKIAVVGSGNIWTDVYTELEKYNVTAIGGRVAGIGVGGLTLGGGLSYLSSQHGWACDNVQAYEIVLADGQIVLANETSHSDLFWALRGGGNNFGIVTKFHQDLYDHGTMYAGYQVFEEKHLPAVLDAYDHQVTHSASDPHALGWVVWMYYNKTALAMAELAYTKNERSPAIYKQYLDLPNVHSTRNETMLAAYTIKNWELQPDGFRNMYHAVTTQYSHEFNTFARDLYFEMIRAFPTEDIRSLVPAYIIHPVTMPMLRHMRKRGGNALGLDPDGSALQIHQVSMSWADEHDDEKIYRFTEAFCARLKEKAEQMGIMHRYMYMNYGSMFQDVIAGYGEENKRRLIEVAERYDPTAVFQRLQPGHFKLRGGPWRSVDEWVKANEDGINRESTDAGESVGGKKQQVLRDEL